MPQVIQYEGRLSEIVENFDLLDDWTERYRYLVELGDQLPELAQSDKVDQNLIPGCVSRVWMVVSEENATQPARLLIKATSDAAIVRGLVYVVISMFDRHTAQEIVDFDFHGLFNRLGLLEHLTPQRANGLMSMIAKLREAAAIRLIS